MRGAGRAGAGRRAGRQAGSCQPGDEPGRGAPRSRAGRCAGARHRGERCRLSGEPGGSRRECRRKFGRSHARRSVHLVQSAAAGGGVARSARGFAFCTGPAARGPRRAATGLGDGPATGRWLAVSDRGGPAAAAWLGQYGYADRPGHAGCVWGGNCRPRGGPAQHEFHGRRDDPGVHHARQIPRSSGQGPSLAGDPEAAEAVAAGGPRRAELATGRSAAEPGCSRRDDRHPSRRQSAARRDRRNGNQRARRGLADRRAAARDETGRRPDLCRHDQRQHLAAGAGDESRRRHLAGPDRGPRPADAGIEGRRAAAGRPGRGPVRAGGAADRGNHFFGMGTSGTERHGGRSHTRRRPRTVVGKWACRARWRCWSSRARAHWGWRRLPPSWSARAAEPRTAF